MAMLFENGPFNEDTYMAESFKSLRDKYNARVVVETGTYHGRTTTWFAQNFDKVYTTEIHPGYFNIAKTNLTNLTNVEQNLGDSSVLLEGILKKLGERVIVFLDAHWYTNPVLKELEAIKNSGKKPILAIHDFKVPDRPDFGYDVYPEQNIVYEWKWIESYIDAIYGKDNYVSYYNRSAIGAKRGCVFVVDKQIYQA